MNYDAYYKLCREKYAQTTQCEFDHDRFYGNPVVLLPVDKFTPEYGDTVNVLSQKVKKDFDLSTGNIVKTFGDYFKKPKNK